MTRRRRRGILLVVLAILALIVVWVFRETIVVLNGQPDVAVDHRGRAHRMQLAAIGVAEDRAADAWRRLERLLELTDATLAEVRLALPADVQPRHPGDGGAIDFGWVLGGRELPADLDRERRALTALDEAGVFDRLAEVADGPPPLRPLATGEDWRTFLPLPEMSRVRQLAKARAASMRIALAEGDLEAVTTAFDEIMALAQAVSHQGTIIEHLVGSAIAALATQELRRELLEAPFGEAMCRRLLEVIGTRRLGPVEIALEGERSMFHDAVQRVYTDDGDGDGYMIPGRVDQFAPQPGPGRGGDGIGRLFAAFGARFVLPTRREMATTYDGIMDGYVGEARLAPHERWRGDLQPEGRDPPLSGRFTLIGQLMPALGRFLEQDGRTRLEIEATRVAIALELFRARHGNLPAALEELAPDILPEPPVDPVTGGPFVYRRLDDGDGRSFVLYSLGPDGVDDGGTETNSGGPDIRLDRLRSADEDPSDGSLPPSAP